MFQLDFCLVDDLVLPLLPQPTKPVVLLPRCHSVARAILFPVLQLCSGVLLSGSRSRCSPVAALAAATVGHMDFAEAGARAWRSMRPFLDLRPAAASEVFGNLTAHGE